VKSAKGRRRYNPIEAAEKAALKKVGWDQTLVRFRDQLDDTLNSVRNGQPSGGFVPEMALAKIEELAKDNLKRSVSGCFYCVIVHRFTNSSTWQQPLRDTRAADGTRSRHIEDYLKGLIGAICRAESTPEPDVVKSKEDDTSVAALSRRKCFLSFRPGARTDLDRVL